MSRRNRTEKAKERALAAAEQLKPVAKQIGPVAKSAGDAAGRHLRKTRAWAAPRVEHSGQVLQNRVAPRVAKMLTSAAERIDPGKRTGRRWRVATAAGLTAAASAAAAVLGKRKLGAGDANGHAEGASSSPNGQPADAGLSTEKAQK